MRYAFATVVAAAIAGVANAWTKPVGDSPIGNPFRTPELATQVPKGKPYQVTWEPTIDKAGTVTILLLRGPGSNAVPQYPIAEKIPNSGSFTWTPSNDLEVDNSRYGLQLIVDATGQYQYTPQFGISGEKNTPSPSYSVAPPPVSESVTGRPEEPKPTSTPAVSQISDGQVQYPTAVPPSPNSSKTAPVYITSNMDVTTCIYPSASGSAPAGTGAPGVPLPPVDTPVSPPIGSAPAGSPSSSAPASESSIATGAAGKTVVASGAAVVVALFALAL